MDQLTSVQQLLDNQCTRYFKESRGIWVFRGHSNIKFKLIPSVGRDRHHYKSRDIYEKSLFDIFKREAHGYADSLPLDPWELLSLAQHHGLPTRLLDWTHNPLAALYFTVYNNHKLDGEFFALHSSTRVAADTLSESPFLITQPMKYYPNTVTPRIRAQEGLFVAFSNVEQPLDLPLRKDWMLERFIVPARYKEKIRYQLFRLGVHDSSLFPGIDGLSARLKWQHSVTPPK